MRTIMSSDQRDKPQGFYEDAEQYWKKIPPTIDGMLGGYSHISSTDIAGSTKFLRELIKERFSSKKPHRALDCGAGIGRITKRLLLPNFETVDMVELNQSFLDQAKQFIGKDANRVDKLINCGLQKFVPEECHYDVIWCQWVLGHLTDSDLVTFFKQCKRGIKENGVIVLKENMGSSEQTEFDEQDSSYTRTRIHLVNLIGQSGLTIVKEEKQKNFPQEIYEVRMFALQ